MKVARCSCSRLELSACPLIGLTPQWTKEAQMPVLLLWAIPAVIVVGGGTYFLMHLH